MKNPGLLLRAETTTRALFKLTLIISLLSGALGTPSKLSAQLPSSEAYAVATIKPSASGDDSQAIMSYPGGRFLAKGMTLKALIAAAYGIRFGSENQVVGGPPWVTSMRFDIEAKPELPTPVDGPSSHYGPALQALLAERFGLKIHHDTRQAPVFRLEVATNGPKLTQSPNAALQGDNSRHSVVLGTGHVIRRDTTMKTFAEGLLQFQPEVGGRAVIDATGLAGKYDFEFQWTPEANDPAASGVQKDDVWPALFTALREQLGLKLEHGTGPIDVLVIDSAKIPSKY